MRAFASKVQQSHHCGIETWLVYDLKQAVAWQQSHHCGIETSILPLSAAMLPCSNRTIVGLKRGGRCGDGGSSGSSNRTIVGLKLEAVGG